MPSQWIPLLIAAHSLAAPQGHALPAPVLVAHQPTETVTALAGAYTNRSLATLEQLFTEDYRFHFSPQDSAGRAWADGLTREHELVAARAMFIGPPAGAPTSRPDTLEMKIGTVETGIDPEHPDSTCQYRLLVAHDCHMRLVFNQDTSSVETQPALHVFHVVRGDAAVRAPGEPADTTRWYIRRWIEDIDAVSMALAAVDGDCGGDQPAPFTQAPTAIGLRAVNAPLCPTLKLLCDLPGTEPAHLEVFDLQGRRVGERTVTPQSPGTVLLEAGGGARFAPGAYWVRLEQAKRPPVTRMVLVAR